MKNNPVSAAAASMARACAVAAALGACQGAIATELVYVPVNPSFGGSPLNGSILLNEALATNRHTDPEAGGSPDTDTTNRSLQSFQSALENNILNRLASAATTKLVDANGNFVPGTFDTANYTITIGTPQNGVVTVTTLDKISGGTTVFQVQQP